MTRKICVITGSRAEYGLLRWVMKGIEKHPELSLSVIATGTHLSPEFGLTRKDIEGDGFHIDAQVEMLLSSDTNTGITKSVGLGVIGFADALERLVPDLVLVLGDRFEVLAAVISALFHHIPVAHLHGGEITEGAVDDQVRHAITKMSQLHFVATRECRKRVIQLGEEPERVFNVGGLGVDSIRRSAIVERKALEDSLGFRFLQRNLLITFHPETLGEEDAETQFTELLDALKELRDVRLIFTMPNADAEGRKVYSMIEEFVSRNANAVAFVSMGQERYLSCLKHVDGVIGNSSSGILEAPTLKTGTVNIGGRQRGRERAESIIDCVARKTEILGAIQKLYSDEFQSKLAEVQNPYGNGGASEKIVDLIASLPEKYITGKKFYDCDFNSSL